MKENILVHKRLPGQYDILTIMVLTGAVAIVCALQRWPMPTDLKIHATALVVASFCIWTLLRHGSSRAYLQVAYSLVAWSGLLGSGIYQYLRSQDVHAGKLLLLFPSVAFPVLILLSQIHKLARGTPAVPVAERWLTRCDACLKRLPARLGWIPLLVLAATAWGSWALVGLPPQGTITLVIVQLLVLSFYRRTVRGRTPGPPVEAGAGLLMVTPFIVYSVWIYRSARHHLPDADLFFGIAMLMLGLFAIGCVIVLVRGNPVRESSCAPRCM
jgi:hypothetical protein